MFCVGKRGETDIKVEARHSERYGDRDIQRDTKGNRTEVVGGRMID